MSRGGRDGVGGGPVARAYVGGDLHSLVARPNVMYVGGHQGVGVSRDGGRSWLPIPSLAGADAMSWAFTPRAVLVGGHYGLRRSVDGGQTFTKAVGAPVEDVHALGATGSTVYLASPQGGFFVSADGGTRWRLVSPLDGRSFMGSLLVDPADPAHVFAPDMRAGVVETRDGGRTWRAVGGLQGVMAIAWEERDRRHLFAVGMDGGAVSTDAGVHWQPLQVPTGAAAIAAASDGSGSLYVGVLRGDRGVVSVSRDGGRSWQSLN